MSICVYSIAHSLGVVIVKSVLYKSNSPLKVFSIVFFIKVYSIVNLCVLYSLLIVIINSVLYESKSPLKVTSIVM